MSADSNGDPNTPNETVAPSAGGADAGQSPDSGAAMTGQDTSATVGFVKGMILTLLGALVLLFGWFAVTGFLGFRAANSVQSDAEAAVDAMRDGDSEAAVAALADLRTSAQSADARFNSIPWSWAADFPMVGSSIWVVGSIAEGTNAVALTTEGREKEIIDSVQKLAADGAAGLAGLSDLAPMAEQAATAIEPFAAQVEAVPLGSVIGGPVRDAMTDFLGVAEGVEAAAGAAKALPVMLGTDSPRTWMVIVQNTAEARGTGGLIGAYSIVSVKDGKFDPKSAQTTNKLFESQTIPLGGIPADTRKFWGPSLSKWWGLNMDRNFPFAGLLSARGIGQAGSPVDDVISIDSQAVAALLEVTGPVTAAGVTIDADNAADYFTKGIYEQFPDPEKKDAVTIALTGKMLESISGDSLDVGKLWDALGPVAAQGRLLTYSTDAAVQKQLERMPTAGLVPDAEIPWATVAVNDLAGSKMDAYLDVEVVYESATRCENPDVVSRIVVTATNNAPEGLPKYVDVRTDGGGGPGSTRIGVATYAPVGSGLAGYWLDGEPVALDSGSNRAHPTWMAAIELERGQSREYVVEFFEPRNFSVQPEFSAQPMTNPMVSSVVNLC